MENLLSEYFKFSNKKDNKQIPEIKIIDELNPNKILKENYPLEISFNKINSLSHLYISSNNYNKFFPFNINTSEYNSPDG